MTAAPDLEALGEPASLLDDETPSISGLAVFRRGL